MREGAAPTVEALLAEREWLRRLARVLVREEADAADLEQETWVAALRAPPERPGPVRGWLATVLRRKAADSRRAAGRRGAREEAAARPEALPSAAEAAARAEMQREVLDAVLGLEEPYRTVVLLRFFEDLPPSAIADRTGVPLETVRTRLRRAMERLRARLDGERGGREAWVAALLRTAGHPGAPAPGPGADGGGEASDSSPTTPPAGVATRSLIVLVAVASVIVAGRTFLRSRTAVPAPAADVAAAPPAAEGASPPQAPIPPDPTPAPPPAAAVPAAEVAPPAPAGKGVLVLRARVDPETPRYGEPFRLVATLENAGRAPLTVFVPDDAGDEAFPDWRFRGAQAEEYAPVREMFRQSMWQAGPIGEILTLEPGKSWSIESPVRVFAGGAADPAKRGEGPFPLRPGSYVASCFYAQPTSAVPWTFEFGDRAKTKEVEGLWTGIVKAEEFSFRVLPGDVPGLVLSGPETLAAGGSRVLDLAIENGADAPRELRGRLLLTSFSKGLGCTRSTELMPGDPCVPAAAGETAVLRLEPRGTLRLRVDLSRLPGDWLRPGGLMCEAVFLPEGDRERIVSNTLVRRVDLPPDAGARGLRLRLFPQDGGRIAVSLRNEGTRPILMPKGLEWPARLHVSLRLPADAPGDGFFSVTGADGRSTLTSREAAWTVGGPARTPVPEDFAELAAGGSIEGSILLADAEYPVIPAGKYEIRAAWFNLEDGARAGLPVGSALVGAVTSEPVPLEVAPE